MMILQRYQIATMALLIGSASHKARKNTSMVDKVMADSLLPAVIHPPALVIHPPAVIHARVLIPNTEA